ncbi:hypothetical protein N0V90_008108 [Kalmusia sp. IMI 367209]|nr:hypothetical protein N0V90_008108 [Kalmusia sp. IMI 367209]
MQPIVYDIDPDPDTVIILRNPIKNFVPCDDATDAGDVDEGDCDQAASTTKDSDEIQVVNDSTAQKFDPHNQ